MRLTKENLSPTIKQCGSIGLMPDVNFKAHDGLHDHQRAREGAGGSATTSGPHSSNLASKMDPRVDSDRDGRSGLGTTEAGTGTATGVGNNMPVRRIPLSSINRASAPMTAKAFCCSPNIFGRYPYGEQCLPSSVNKGDSKES